MIMEEQLVKEARRRRRSKWRTGVWLLLVGCVALLSFILSTGLFPDSDPILKLEAFAGFFVVGCAFLVVSRYSANKKRRDADL
jgi:hypothetical protein